MKRLNSINILILSLCALITIPSFAAKVDWKLTFRDVDGIVVGNGRFSYDPDTLSRCLGNGVTGCVHRNPDDFFNETNISGVYTEITDSFIRYNNFGRIEEFKTYSELETGVMDVLGARWYLHSGEGAWWYDSTISLNPGTMRYEEKVSTVFSHEWRFFDLVNNGYEFRLGPFTQVSDALWTASWSQEFFDIPLYPDVTVISEKTGSGIATATLVPVPGALALFFPSFALLVWKFNKT